jgi:hypothetical protein
MEMMGGIDGGKIGSAGWLGHCRKSPIAIEREMGMGYDHGVNMRDFQEHGR